LGGDLKVGVDKNQLNKQSLASLLTSTLLAAPGVPKEQMGLLINY